MQPSTTTWVTSSATAAKTAVCSSAPVPAVRTWSVAIVTRSARHPTAIRPASSQPSESWRVPASSRLPGCRSFRDVARVLTLTRYTVAWRALGDALAAYEAALAYAKEREQFGHPLASFQLVQDKLSRMVGEITAMQLLCLRLSELAGDERLTPGMASLAKMNHAAKARAIVADARDILGGNGILLEHHVARHHADMEAVFTFEGTDSIQSLIVGRELTGIQAIAPPRGGG